VRSAFLWVWALVATAVVLWLALFEAAPIPPGWVSEQLEPWRPQPDRLVLKPSSFTELPGWTEDSVAEALPAVERSCAATLRRAPSAEVRPATVGGRVADWVPACEALRALGPLAGVDELRARAYLEGHFTPLRVLNGDRERGTFTGYYEPLLRGSRRRSDVYRVPLYTRPGDIVQVELGPFREEWSGRSIAGRWTGRTLEPYWSREEIERGALRGRRLELLWVDDPVDAFFLQIQGSGQVEMKNGDRIRVGYAGQNGHPYYAIGRELIDRGALQRAEVSMQSIRRWLEENPQQAVEVMATNASYVFFRELRGDGPLGSQGVALLPERSLAVDRTYIPMGAPVWVDATRPVDAADAVPDPVEGWPQVPLQRLLVAQDTGGAIRGPVRGDVFWGPGERAAEIAGRMNSRGRIWLLLPKGLAQRVLEDLAENPPGSGASGATAPGS
jgi:membrane-bound lytic murein transglycosylase A